MHRIVDRRAGPFIALHEIPTILLTPVPLQFLLLDMSVQRRTCTYLAIYPFYLTAYMCSVPSNGLQRMTRAQNRSVQSCIIEHVAEDLEPTKLLVCGVFIWGKTVSMPTTCKDARIFAIASLAKILFIQRARGNFVQKLHATCDT